MHADLYVNSISSYILLEIGQQKDKHKRHNFRM